MIKCDFNSVRELDEQHGLINLNHKNLRYQRSVNSK